MLRRIIFVAIGVILLATSMASTKEQDSSSALPKGNWGLTVGVARQATPVDVASVTTEVQKGFAVASVKLKNHTNLNVAAVKLHWSISETKDPSRILLDGNTRLIEVSIAPGETAILNYPVVSFAKAHKPLLINGELNGDFRIEIRTSKVKYADPSGKRLTDSQALNLLIAKSVLPPEDDAPCADKGCFYDSSEHKYKCIDSVGAKCSPSSNGQSCTESRCGS